MVKNVGREHYMVVTCAPLTVWDDTPTSLVKPASFRNIYQAASMGQVHGTRWGSFTFNWGWVRNEVE